jgi:hypothetical protein
MKKIIFNLGLLLSLCFAMASCSSMKKKCCGEKAKECCAKKEGCGDQQKCADGSCDTKPATTDAAAPAATPEATPAPTTKKKTKK